MDFDSGEQEQVEACVRGLRLVRTWSQCLLTVLVHDAVEVVVV